MLMSSRVLVCEGGWETSNLTIGSMLAGENPENQHDTYSFFHTYAVVRPSKCHRKTASKKFSQKIHHCTNQNPECRCGRAGSICPFEKQTFSRKTKHFFSWQFCTSLPTNKSTGRKEQQNNPQQQENFRTWRWRVRQQIVRWGWGLRRVGRQKVCSLPRNAGRNKISSAGYPRNVADISQTSSSLQEVCVV